MRKLRGLLLGYAAIALVAGAPVISVIFTMIVANANGCVVHEGDATPCVVMGTDIGEALYVTGMMGWFALATIPMGVIAFVLWTVTWLLWRRVKARKAQVQQI